ncbi:MAG: tetratricopeptide repeat protein [Acidobacteriota bacterium]|nr:tetratricopeptide repeat protein [Acidobacteriota bacterium]
MNFTRSSLAVLLLAATAAFAQHPGATSKKPADTPEANPHPYTETPVPDRNDAYYHFQKGRGYEEMVATTGQMEYATKAIEEYKLALAADPKSSFLSAALADIYARTGDIRDAVAQAQEVIQVDPDNLEARRLLGRIYLRSIGDLQGNSKESETVLHMAIEQFEAVVRLDASSVEDHLLLGRLYRLNNEMAKAEVEFRVAVKLQPDSEDAVTTLAVLYNEEGDSTRALELLSAIPQTDRSARIETILGYTYEQKKDYKKAIEAYRHAVELDHDNLDAVRGLAQNLLNDNQYGAALEQYKAVSEADPQDAQTMLHLADIYRHDGEFEKALQSLDKAQQAAPDSMEIFYNRAVVLEALGKYDDATGVLVTLLARTEHVNGSYSTAEKNNRAIFLERLGTIYREQNKTQPAVDAFRKLVELGDDATVRGYQQLIETYRDAKDWPAATAVAKEAVEKVPNDHGLQMVLASQLADNGEPDAALAKVKSLLNGQAGNDREVWIALGQMYSRVKRYPEAEQALDKALELSTKQEEKDFVNFIAGSVYEREKKYELAENVFRKVLASDAKNAGALNYLGYMLADRGTRLNEALELIKRAVALEPQNGAYLDSLGWVYFKMGKYDQAETELRKAVERIDNDPTLHEHLGDVYQKTNRLKQAAAQWERSLEEWKKTIPAEMEPDDVAKVQKKLDGARVKLAKEGSAK